MQQGQLCHVNPAIQHALEVDVENGADNLTSYRYIEVRLDCPLYNVISASANATLPFRRGRST